MSVSGVATNGEDGDDGDDNKIVATQAMDAMVGRTD